MSLTIEAAQLIEEIATKLNQRVASPTGLTINDREIWNNYLHRWNNREWLIMLSVLERLYDQHPEYFSAGHKTVIDECLKYILQHGDTEPRVLDQNRSGLHFKGTAWRAICSIREIYNAIQGWDIPNEITTRSAKQANK